MADVLSSPAPPTDAASQERAHSPAPIESPSSSQEPGHTQSHDASSSHAQKRISTLSQQTSRPASSVTPAFPSSLPYAQVRDFAYPSNHPYHYGAPPDPPSGTSTPGSEWNLSRRLSDPADAGSSGASHSAWTPGPWGGDGSMYGEPDEQMEALPSTSFSTQRSQDGPSYDDSRKSRHRKSRSYASATEFERGRRADSGQRGGAKDADVFYFASGGQMSDPAGRDMLRQDRGLGIAENGSSRGSASNRARHSHHRPTLSNSRFSYIAAPPTTGGLDTTRLDHNGNPYSAIPLDSEFSDEHQILTQRHSMGPEDEDLFAGPSLALYGFEPENSNELRLVEGQVVLVAYRHGQGWLVAQDLETGEQGLVPEAYVRLLKDIDGWDAEKGRLIDDIEDDEANDDHDDQTMHDDYDSAYDRTPVAGQPFSGLGDFVHAKQSLHSGEG